MDAPVVRRSRWGWSSSWAALPSFLLGLVFTDFRPIQGAMVGVAALLVAVVLFLWDRAPRWLAWLALGVAVGVAALYLLALLQVLNPGSASGSGSGSASASAR